MSSGDAFSFANLRYHSYPEFGAAVRVVDDSNGEALTLPWVAPEYELWNSTVDRLTLFFDPGRIKQGVGPNVTHGPPLVACGVYRLVIDADWVDAGGKPLVASHEKRLRVVAPRPIVGDSA